MDRNPEPKPAPLVTAYMWKMILGQAIYQISITLILYFAGKRIFHSIKEIRDELTFLRIVRGGHLNQLKYHRRNLREIISDIFERTPRGGSVMRPPPHRRRYRSSSRASSHVGAAVMIPSIVAGNIGGWSPVERPANPSPGSSKTPPVDTIPSEGPPDGNMTGLALV